jgi:hypothetical protein
VKVVYQKVSAQRGIDVGQAAEGDGINVVEAPLFRASPVTEQMPAGGYAPGEDDRLGEVSRQLRKWADAFGNILAGK